MSNAKIRAIIARYYCLNIDRLVQVCVSLRIFNFDLNSYRLLLKIIIENYSICHGDCIINNDDVTKYQEGAK